MVDCNDCKYFINEKDEIPYCIEFDFNFNRLEITMNGACSKFKPKKKKSRIWEKQCENCKHYKNELCHYNYSTGETPVKDCRQFEDKRKNLKKYTFMYPGVAIASDDKKANDYDGCEPTDKYYEEAFKTEYTTDFTPKTDKPEIIKRLYALKDYLNYDNFIEFKHGIELRWSAAFNTIYIKRYSDDITIEEYINDISDTSDVVKALDKKYLLSNKNVDEHIRLIYQLLQRYKSYFVQTETDSLTICKYKTKSYCSFEQEMELKITREKDIVLFNYNRSLRKSEIDENIYNIIKDYGVNKLLKRLTKTIDNLPKMIKKEQKRVENAKQKIERQKAKRRNDEKKQADMIKKIERKYLKRYCEHCGKQDCEC